MKYQKHARLKTQNVPLTKHVNANQILLHKTEAVNQGSVPPVKTMKIVPLKIQHAKLKMLMKRNLKRNVIVKMDLLTLEILVWKKVHI